MSNASELLEELRHLHFLADLAPAYLERMASIAKLIECAPNQVLFREGDRATKAYLLMSGAVALEICAPAVGCKRICTLSEGDLIAWSPLLEQGRLTATARTLDSTRLVEVDAGQLLALCEHDPRFGYEIMRRMALALAKRLNATRLQLVDVYGTQMPPAAPTTTEGTA